MKKIKVILSSSMLLFAFFISVSTTYAYDMDNDMGTFTIDTSGTYDRAVYLMTDDLESESILMHLPVSLINSTNNYYISIDLLKYYGFPLEAWVVEDTIIINLFLPDAEWYLFDLTNYTTNGTERLQVELYRSGTSITLSEMGYMNDEFYVSSNAYLDSLVVEQDYNDGFADGIDYGFLDGYNSGYDFGENAGYIDGYGTGQDNMFDNGSAIYSYTRANAFDYIYGQDDMFDNGSATYGYTLVNAYDYILALDNMFDNGSSTYDYIATNAYDYDLGYTDGSLLNVNQASTNFMNDFNDWVVPAILLVILLGGFMTIGVMKRRGE